MKLEDIGFYTLSDERARTATSTTAIKRLEILITDRCNFKCPYCRGMKPDLRGEVSFESFKATLDHVGSIPENIRFSGGEPTLNLDLLKMVRYSNFIGTKRIAISTNGSAPLETYLDLIDSGANDFSISLDACCQVEFSKMSGGSGEWNRVRENIRQLSRQTYVTVGIVLDQGNETEAERIVSYADELGVADIRIIPAAQFGSSLARFTINNPTRPILRYRINNAKNDVPVRGLSENDFHRCPLVLDDVAIAGGKHFPCIIYLREGGCSIGPVAKGMRNERERWFKETDVFKDRICRGNCLDVCRDYNNRWMAFSLENISLDKLPADSFSLSRWRNGTENIKSLVGSWRYSNIVSGAKKIREIAAGWIYADELVCRPKSENIALMFKIQDELGWIHLRSNELWEIYREFQEVKP
ncbi:MAG: radical SAM protein [Dehalococcoidia bacterium]|jgi:MoaA/NifB/PqqE/SkfB family radical SAM enzyme